MSDVAQLSLEQQIEAFQKESAGKAPPEMQALRQVRRAQLVESGIANRALKTGETVPAFTLPDAYGTPVTLYDLLAHGPVVLTFYRGDWCPFCNLTLRAYQAALPAMTALQATLVAVSPQNPDYTLLTVQHKELTYPVLSDLGNQVARQFGLVWSIPEDQRSTSANLSQFNGDDSWELPISGTFVIAQNGVIELAVVDADWTHRLEPQTIIETLRKLDIGHK